MRAHGSDLHERIKKLEALIALAGGSSPPSPGVSGLPVINVRDPAFGATGNGVTNDTAAINAAVAALPGVGEGGTAILYFPPGQYLVRSTVPGSAAIEIDNNVTVLGAGQGQSVVFSDDPTSSLFRIADAFNVFDSMAFAHGKSAIVANGPSHIINPGGSLGSTSIESLNVVRNCHFLYHAGPAIILDTTMEPGNGSNAEFTVEDSFFQTSCFCWAGWNGYMRWNRCYCFMSQSTAIDANAVPVFDDNGVILPGFTNYSLMTVDNLVGVPQFATGLNGAWAGGSGNFQSRDDRWGGETLGVLYRVSTSLKYNGQTMASQTSSVTFPVLQWLDSACSSPANFNWLEIYDVFPMLIDMRITIPSVLPSSSDPRLLILQSNGVFIDSATCPKSTYLGTDQQNVQINFQGLPVGQVMSFRTGTSPLRTVAAEDVTGQLHQYMVVDFKGPRENQGSQTNLYHAGRFQFLQADAVSGSFLISGTDTTTGRSVDIINVVAAPPGSQIITDYDNFTLDLAAGEYTFSMMVKADFGERLYVSFADPGTFANPLGVASVDFSHGGWQRLEFTFYTDGTNKALQLLVQVPQGGHLTGPAYFALHVGRKAQPWTWPQVPNSDTLILQELYGIAPPVIGTAIVGDRMWNTAPAPGAPLGWSCTAAGTPGRWDPWASVLFSPEDIAGLTFDYNPVGLTPGAITAWPDASPSGFTLTGTATAAASGGPNNLPIVTTNGSTDFMTNEESSAHLASEVFLVAKYVVVSNGTIIDGGTPGNGGRVYTSGAGTTINVGGTAVTGISANTGIYSIWHILWDGANATVTIDGTVVIGPTADVDPGVRNGVTLGNFGLPGGDPANVAYARALGYSAPLSAGDRTKVLSYLQTTYGVS